MIPGWEHLPRTGAGAFTGGGPKLCLHTTEGNTIAGAVAALDRNRSWSHFLISFEENKKIQFLETNVAAKSLSNNTADGYQTNRANVVQVEIVGYAKETGSWSNAKLDWIADRLKEIRGAFAFPLDHLNFADSQRLSDQQFVAYSGIVGHKHVPDNDHWDPGNLNVDYIVAKMGSPTPPIKGIDVTVFQTFNSTISADADGRGYVDVYHNKGADPTVSIAQTNGNDPKTQGYPQIGTPVFLTAGFSGAFVRVTVVGAKPKSQFGFKLLCGW